MMSQRQTPLRQHIVDLRIAFYARHVGSGCQRLGDLTSALHQDRNSQCRRNECSMPRSRNHRRIDLCVVWLLFHKVSCTKTPLFVLRAQSGSPAQVGLVCQHNHEFGLLATAVCATTHGAILFATFTGLPPTRWLIAREEPSAPNAVTPAAITRSRQKTFRNRLDTNARFEFGLTESLVSTSW